MAALLLTLVLLFAFQGEAIIRQPLVIAMLAVPILIQVFFNSGLAYWLNKRAGEKHSVACPSALIGASNFFELAVAAAIFPATESSIYFCFLCRSSQENPADPAACLPLFRVSGGAL